MHISIARNKVSAKRGGKLVAGTCTGREGDNVAFDLSAYSRFIGKREQAKRGTVVQDWANRRRCE